MRDYEMRKTPTDFSNCLLNRDATGDNLQAVGIRHRSIFLPNFPKSHL